MTSDLSASDWHDIIETARAEGDSGTGEPVGEETLRSTVRQRLFEPDASPYIQRALTNGWIEAHDHGDERVFVLADEDVASLDEFLGTSETDSERVQECLAAAVDYYHRQLSSIQRDWIHDKWGLPDEVIDELQIGWVDSSNDLVEQLRGEGYSDAEIARAGLATSNALKHVYRCHEDDCSHYDAPRLLDDLRDARIAEEIEVAEIDPQAVVEYAVEEGWHRLYDWWDKRIVFPYPDAEGDYRYLIARKTHASDDVAGKYLKLQVRPHTDDEAVYEPIYGVHDFEGGSDLVLTEGITDAIWAHHRGLDCLAPVTKRFKREHTERLVDLAEDAERVYLVNDAEESGTGLKAALRTADELDEAGIDVRVAELPRGEDEMKIDLAEYLADHTAADLRSEVLSSAVEPCEHPAYDEAVDEDEQVGGDEDYNAPTTSGVRDSALFDLTISQVVEQDSRYGVRKGYRGDNPIEHVGDSHSDYFVYERYRGDVRARDFKADHTYTPLTWLACAAGVRDTESPGGQFSDEEVWECWKYAKDERMIPDDDPVPYRVMEWLAIREGLLEEEYPVDEEGIPAATYNAVLTIIEERHGYDPGRKMVGSERAEKAARAEVEKNEAESERERIGKTIIAELNKTE